MVRIIKTYTIIISGIVLLATACATALEPNAFEMNKLIGRGVNLGNALEAPNEGDWDIILQEEYFQLVKDSGFNSIRQPVRWDNHALTTAPYTIDPNFLARVDWAVKNALSRNLIMIINMHNYYDLFKDPNNQKERFLAIWQQIAEHYKDYPGTLLFEALNEPADNLKNASAWNNLLKEWLAVIRKSNPKRMVVVGSANFNAFYDVKNIVLPEEDQNIIVTFHYYMPYRFTHQGAPWVPDSNKNLGMKWNGTDTEKRAIAGNFHEAASWGQKHNRPIYLGEFGTYNKVDPESRVLWTRAVADEAIKQGFSFAYWEFCHSNFGIYNPKTKTWNKPLVDALIPPKQ